jgi:hypothetical protein
MKKTVLTFGAIASVLLAISVSVTTWILKRNGGHMESGEVFGYLSMLIAFAFIFMAVKSYRDRYLGGVISFKTAFSIGLWVTLIASAAYTITWVILYKGFYPEFMNDYTAHSLQKMQASGKSAAEIQKATADAQDLQAMYKTWLGLIGFTLLEILPVGLLISLISALVLKRRVAHGDRAALETVT